METLIIIQGFINIVFAVLIVLLTNTNLNRKKEIKALHNYLDHHVKSYNQSQEHILKSLDCCNNIFEKYTQRLTEVEKIINKQ